MYYSLLIVLYLKNILLAIRVYLFEYNVNLFDIYVNRSLDANKE